jgi:hypothetical protein
VSCMFRLQYRRAPVHAETYVLINSEVDQNGSLETESLLQPGIIRAVTSALDEQFVERTVLFPVFTRYFLARERSFQIMIADLLKHSEPSQNHKPPLVSSADVPRLRHIANKSIGYIMAMYHLFKDTVSETEKDNIALVKSHMKMCIKHYNALIQQLDLIATQWGIDVGRMRAKLASDKRKFQAHHGRRHYKGAWKKWAFHGHQVFSMPTTKRVKAALARKTRAKTAASRIRPDRLTEAAKTGEEGSQIQPEPGPSRGREKDNIALVKLHMKMCVKHYHALIPQFGAAFQKFAVVTKELASLAQQTKKKLKGSKVTTLRPGGPSCLAPAQQTHQF